MKVKYTLFQANSGYGNMGEYKAKAVTKLATKRSENG